MVYRIFAYTFTIENKPSVGKDLPILWMIWVFLEKNYIAPPNPALPSVTTLLAWQVQQPLAREHEAKAEVSLPINKENLDLLKVVGKIENLPQIVF